MLFANTYDPTDWYWIVDGDLTQVYSSARAAYVPIADPTYVAWVETGNRPTAIDSETSLQEVFAAQYPAGWPPTPAQKAQLLLQAGLTVISSTIPFPVATAATPGVTFNTDPGSILKYASVQMRLTATGVFPGSATTWTLKDTLGTEHILTGPQYTVLTSAISDFVSACDRVIDGYTDAALPQNVIDLDPPPAPPTP